MSKILYTTTSYLPVIGGAQLHTHQLAKRVGRWREVQVVTLWDEQRTDWLLGTTINAPTKPKSYTFEGVSVELIALTMAERYRLWPYVLSYYVFKSTAIERIAATFVPKIELLAQGCTVIHNARIGREPLSFASLKVAHQLDVPFVFTPYHHPRWVGWNYRDYLNLYRQADALVALTQAEKQTLIDLGVAEKRIFVIGNGAHVAKEADGGHFRQLNQIPMDVPLILFLGQKYAYKGFEHLVKAAKIVWKKWAEAYFVFIGPRTNFSKQFFARQPHDRRLIELDTVDLQQKTDALAACTLLCLPSTQESFGGVYTEAWMFNKPVIGADIPSVREVIDDGINGYVVSPNGQFGIVRQLAERIDYLLANPTLAEKMGRAGRAKTLDQYNWDKLAQKMEDVYLNIM